MIVSANTQSNRNGLIELLRLLASLGIVWFHVGAVGSSIAYGGLPLFTILLIAFATTNANDRSWFRVVQKRAVRLLIPWLVWSGIYAMANVMDAAYSNQAIQSEFHFWMLFTGPAIHLWFLPFAFVTSVLASILSCHVHTYLRERSFLVLCTMLPVLSFTAAKLLEEYEFTIPLPQWIFVLPSVCLGLMLGFAPPNSRLAKLAMLFSIAASLLFTWDVNEGRWSIPFLVGATSALIGWHLFLPSNSWTEYIGRLALPVYLVHPLVIAFLQRILAKDTSLVVIACGACFISIMLAIGLGWLRGRMLAVVSRTAFLR